MKKAVYIICIVLVVLCAGCSSTKEKETPVNNNTKQERILRDPFRPDHPTRQEWEAEKERKELASFYQMNQTQYLVKLISEDYTSKNDQLKALEKMREK